MKEKLFELLAEEGFRPKFNDQDDIEFVVEGLSQFIDFDEQDPSYVSMVLPHFWSISDPEELSRAYVAASYACRAVKGVKVYVVNDASVWSTVEYLVETVDSVSATLLKRHLEMIRYGWIEFRDKMAELREMQAEASAERELH